MSGKKASETGKRLKNKDNSEHHKRKAGEEEEEEKDKESSTTTKKPTSKKGKRTKKELTSKPLGSIQKDRVQLEQDMALSIIQIDKRPSDAELRRKLASRVAKLIVLFALESPYALIYKEFSSEDYNILGDQFKAFKMDHDFFNDIAKELYVLSHHQLAMLPRLDDLDSEFFSHLKNPIRVKGAAEYFIVENKKGSNEKERLFSRPRYYFMIGPYRDGLVRYEEFATKCE